MSLNLVGIAGAPAGVGDCGCAPVPAAGMGAYWRPMGEDASALIPPTPGQLPASVPRWVPTVAFVGAVGVMLWLIVRMERMEEA